MSNERCGRRKNRKMKAAGEKNEDIEMAGI